MCCSKYPAPAAALTAFYLVLVSALSYHCFTTTSVSANSFKIQTEFITGLLEEGKLGRPCNGSHYCNERFLAFQVLFLNLSLYAWPRAHPITLLYCSCPINRRRGRGSEMLLRICNAIISLSCKLSMSLGK